MMTNGDREGWIFLSHPHMNNGFFFFLTIKYHILKRFKEVPEYAEIRYDMMTPLKQWRHLTTMHASSNTTNVQSPLVTAWVR